MWLYRQDIVRTCEFSLRGRLGQDASHGNESGALPPGDIRQEREEGGREGPHCGHELYLGRMLLDFRFLPLKLIRALLETVKCLETLEI